MRMVNIIRILFVVILLGVIFFMMPRNIEIAPNQKGLINQKDTCIIMHKTGWFWSNKISYVVSYRDNQGVYHEENFSSDLITEIK